MYDIEAIKNKITCVEFARDHLNLPIQAAGRRCSSFRPGAKNKTSLLVNERAWFDFGGDTGGDVIDMCADALYNGNKGQAIRHLADITGVPNDNAPMQDFHVFCNQAAFYHRELQPEHREYLHHRGITDETIDTLLIGYAQNDDQWRNRLMFPYWKNGKVTYFIGRALSEATNSKYMKMKSNVMTEHTVWGMDTLCRPGPVIVAEGIFDALSVYQEGYAVISPITGRFSKEQTKDVISMTKDREVVVCLDYDPGSKTGQRATMAIAQTLFMAKRKVGVVMLEGGDNKVDLNELYASGRSVKAILSRAEDFARVQLDELDSKDDIAGFLHDVSRFYSAPDVAELCGYLASLNKVDQKWLRALEQQLRRPPADDHIVKEIVAEYEMLYHEQLGWYEYNAGRGVWQERWETEIKSYISQTLGHYRTGPRINSVYQSLKPECVARQELNSQTNLLNVRNGMLDVLSGKLLPHSASYYSTRQLGYSYDPDADCPNFLQFLSDVTDCDEKRISLIHEMFGYCLLGDARFQTAFFMIGKGANGKSKLLEVLTNMIGVQNCSHVPIDGLLDEFQLTQLYTSMVNICNETSSDVNGAEQKFKHIVGGDAEVNARYLYHNHFTFKPTCKFICAGNNHLESKDVSDGFSRRMCFIEFPMRFVDNPVETNEKKRDYKIMEKLSPEMPGILNWAVQGLRRLLKQGEFTYTDDQARMKAEFMSLSTPLLDFCDYLIASTPELFSIRHPFTDVYKRYVSWAKENGTGQYSSRKFWAELQHHMPYFKTKVNGYNYCTFDVKQTSEHLRQSLAEPAAKYSEYSEDYI